MTNNEYLMLDLKGWHYDSKPRYEADGKLVSRVNSPASIKWPDGTETSEEVVERSVKYNTVMGGEVMTVDDRLQTLAISVHGAKVILASMNGLKVRAKDIRFGS